MSDLLWQGLMISALGMGLTFTALGLLVGVMTLLERLTRGQVSATASLKQKTTTGSLARHAEDEEIAVAITVALAHLQSLDICRSGLGSTLENGHGAWWTRQHRYQHPSDSFRITRRSNGA